MSVNALLLLNRQHAIAVSLQADVIALGETVADTSEDRPVIVSTNTHLGRHMWRQIESIGFFLPPAEELDMYMERLAATDVSRFGFVGSTEAHENYFALLGYRVVTRTGPSLTVFERVGLP